MKKSVKKLSLNKTTISNLDAAMMNQKIGGIKPKPKPKPDTRPTTYEDIGSKPACCV